MISATAFVQFSKIDVKITHNNSVLRNENIILLIYFFSGRRPVRPVKPVRPIRPGKNCTRNISVHFTIFISCKYLAIHSSYFNLCLQEQL